MSAATRLVQDLIEKYRGAEDAERLILNELGPAATEADKVAVKAAVGGSPAAATALSPQDIQARVTQLPPARSITDLAEEPRDPLSLRPERDPFVGKPEAPGPLRALQGGQPTPKEPVQLTKEGTLPPEAMGALQERVQPGKSRAGAKAFAGGALLGAGAAGGLIAGQRPSEQAKQAEQPPKKPSPQAMAEGKKELKQVVTERKEEYPLSSSLKLTSPEDVGAALRAADKDTPDSKLSPDVRKDFAAKRGELETRMKDAEKMYMEALATGKEDRQRRDMIIAVAGVVERLGLALTSYFAAKQGMAMGAPVASQLRIQPSDANAAFDRSLREYDQLVDEQKGLFSFRTRGVEREQEMLGRQEEKFEAGEQRTRERAEDRGFAEGKLAEDKRQFEEAQRLRREEGEAERRSREKIAGMGSESRVEAANIRAAAQAARSSLNNAREEAKRDATKSDAYKKLEGALAVLKSKPSDKTALRTFTESATVLGMPPEEQDEVVTAASGKGLFTLQDVEKARGMTSKYAPGQTAPQAGGAPQAGAAPGGMVRLRNPETGKVHEMTEAEAAEARKYGYTDVR